ncbi:MAG: tagaturonate reductase [Eubacteriales bacterium]
MRETVIQFGEGVFLRGFVDPFLDTLHKQGLYDGKAVVVQPRPGGKVKLLQDQGCGYNLFLRGIKDGEAVSEHSYIQSISRCVNPYTQFDEFMALAENPHFRFVVSNTTEAGIAFDETCRLSDTPCLSFPGKVTQLLYRRFQLALDGFIFLPCELIDNNGDALKACVLRYAGLWGLEPAFSEWVEERNLFANTLVDRIVTGYPETEKETLLPGIGFDDKCLNTAERFGLWVIEGDFERELPLKQGGLPVIWTDDVAPYKKRKVRVLNGAHTSTVFPSLLCGVETVGETMRDKLLRAFLEKNLSCHILPMLGESRENLDFAEAVLERFSNPYIHHRWQAISLNSVRKFTVRVLPTMIDCREQRGEWPKSLVFSLACLLKSYKEQPISDDPVSVAYIREHGIEDILANKGLWEMDLFECTEMVNECLERIQRDTIREAVKWAIL